MKEGWRTRNTSYCTSCSERNSTLIRIKYEMHSFQIFREKKENIFYEFKMEKDLLNNKH